MRLIDADSANERLLDFIAQNDSGIQFAIEHKDMTMLKGIFFDYFEGQPTAYDVDKVVEQLEAESERWKESGEAYEDQKELGVSEGFKKAIEIAKSGGIR